MQTDSRAGPSELQRGQPFESATIHWVLELHVSLHWLTGIRPIFQNLPSGV